MKMNISAMVLGSDDGNWIADLVETGKDANFRGIFVDQLSMDVSNGYATWLDKISSKLAIDTQDHLGRIGDYVIDLFATNTVDYNYVSSEYDNDGALYVTFYGVELDDSVLLAL